MTKKLILLSFIALALMVGGCSKQNPFEAQSDSAMNGGEPTLLAKKVSVPIKGHFETTFQLGPVVQVQGTGLISHLGNSTVFISQIVDFTVAPPTLTGTIEYTAANGDKLYATHSGIVGASDDPDILPYSGEFTFIGGTGRFTDASGSATYTGSANMTALTGQFSFQGNIMY